MVITWWRRGCLRRRKNEEEHAKNYGAYFDARNLVQDEQAGYVNAVDR
jgi:hypothetical protein